MQTNNFQEKLNKHKPEICHKTKILHFYCQFFNSEI